MNNRRFGFEDAEIAADEVRKHSGRDLSKFGVDGVILGSGLGGFAEKYLKNQVKIGFGEIFKKLEIEVDQKKAGVAGHSKELIIGNLDGVTDRVVLAQSGREHAYEGVSTQRATFWLRVMQLLGAETLVGSNASGILTPKNLAPRDLMLVHSDLDLVNDNPLVGLNDDRFGPRFPHMGDLYPQKTRNLAKKIAVEHNIELKEGMYTRVMGPNYERKEDVYRLRDQVDSVWRKGQYSENRDDRFRGVATPVAVVGMSSTYEQMVAQHATQSVKFPAFRKGRVYISVATNYAATLGNGEMVENPSHGEVQENADIVQEKFGKLVSELLKRMGD